MSDEPYRPVFWFLVVLRIQGNASIRRIELHLSLPTNGLNAARAFALRIADQLTDFGEAEVYSSYLLGAETRSTRPDDQDAVREVFRAGSRFPDDPEPSGVLVPGTSTVLPNQVRTGDFVWTRKTRMPISGQPRVYETHSEEKPMVTAPGLTVEKLIESLGLVSQAWLARRAVKTHSTVEEVLRIVIESGIARLDAEGKVSMDHLDQLVKDRTPGNPAGWNEK